MTGGGKRIAARLALALGSVVIALGAAEIALRAAGFDPYGLLVPEPAEGGRRVVLRLSEDETLGYELIPGSRAKAWRTDVEVNSAGFRDREFAPEKPAGVQRIVALGDSITFGNGLALEKTWPKQLERALTGAGRPTEVLDLGVGGYDTLQEAVQLERLGLRFDPDAVVVCFCINDIGRFSINEEQLRRLARSGSLLEQLRVFQFFAQLRAPTDDEEAERSNEEDRYLRENAGKLADLAGDDVLASAMRSLADELAPKLPVPREQRFLPLYASRAHMGRLRFGFERLARLRDAHGFELVLVYVPHLEREPLAKGWEIAEGIVRHEAERLAIPFLTATVEFAELGRKALNLDNGPVHPNASGHAIVAEKVRAFLMAQ